ncbi:AAA family ATPase [Kocuria salina]|uniref:AAA family ATPase n=1 Tax=Kocuria salina TaxID=1929416 RepID=UPI001594DA61
MSKPTLVLVSASATGVLGEYNHSFTIGEHDEFVIIYGPNGVGKTKFLEIIDALTRLRGFTLSKLPFESALLKYSDGSELSAERREVGADAGDASPIPTYNITFTVKRFGRKSLAWEHKDDDFSAYLRRQVRYEQMADEYWQDQADGELVHVEELRNRYRFERESRSRKPVQQTSGPAEALEFVNLVPSFLIETQRLRIEESHTRTRYGAVRESKRPRSRITEQADKIRSLLNDAQTEHSRITQRLDRTFPNRVLGAAARENHLNSDDIRSQYNTQNDFRSRLGRVASVSLDNELSLPSGDLDGWALTLLNQYLVDAEQKLSPFRGLLTKIELLEQIINGRLLNKTLQVTDGDGLSVQHSQSGRPITLDSLSSGEQHEIILMIDLLFNVPPGAVVLIDEPEISLHVAWQIAFIPDVERIAELAGFRFVVATHSPQIINDRWERAIRLGPDEVSFS